jgi:hypothetical protein
LQAFLRLTALCIVTTLMLAAACAIETTGDGKDAARGGSGAIAGVPNGGTTTGGQGGAATSGGSPSMSGAGGSAAGTSGGTGAGAAMGGAASAGAGAGGTASVTGGTGGDAAGTGGAAGTDVAGSGTSGGGGLSVGGGAGVAAGAAGAAGSAIGLGSGTMTGMGRSTEQYETTEVGRNGVPYMLITNGWGPGFESHTVSWNGTSFIVEAMSGSRGSNGQPASYPSVFCGRYSVMQVPDCGLPKPIEEITSLRTGWRWAANGNTGAYNAAYDIWLGTETGFGMYLMVWLRDPPGEQPAGSPDAMHQGVAVANVPGVWDIWSGSVNNRPIINWVRREGTDSTEIEFDVMDFIRDAQMRGLTITGTRVNAVAVGFEIWSGPVTNLESTDFYVDVK